MAQKQQKPPTRINWNKTNHRRILLQAIRELTTEAGKKLNHQDVFDYINKKNMGLTIVPTYQDLIGKDITTHRTKKSCTTELSRINLASRAQYYESDGWTSQNRRRLDIDLSGLFNAAQPNTTTLSEKDYEGISGVAKANPNHKPSKPNTTVYSGGTCTFKRKPTSLDQFEPMDCVGLQAKLSTTTNTHSSYSDARNTQHITTQLPLQLPNDIDDWGNRVQSKSFHSGKSRLGRFIGVLGEKRLTRASVVRSYIAHTGKIIAERELIKQFPKLTPKTINRYKNHKEDRLSHNGGAPIAVVQYMLSVIPQDKLIPGVI